MTRSIAVAGIVAAVAGGYALGGAAARCLVNMQLPGALTVLAAAAVVSGGTVAASLVPAARAPHGWWRSMRGTRKPTARRE